MRVFIFLSVIIVATVAASFTDLEKDEWEAFKLKHSKQYSNETEEMNRMKIYMKNKDKIAQHNNLYAMKKVTYSMKLNKFSDLLHEEVVKMTSCFRPSMARRNSGTAFVSSENVKIPDFIDWRELGAVTPVKTQGDCGSCWAFGVIGSLEGHQFIKTKKLVSLSAQNLVDCVTESDGCCGGDSNQAFQYIIDSGGIDTEENYPYENIQTTCRYNPKNSGATVNSYTSIPMGDEKSLKEAIAIMGPVVVNIDADHYNFYYYNEGVFYESECHSDKDHLSHAATAVGYGTDEDGKDYYIVKNSWGAGWGLDGYILMARNKNNSCGIATDASYPNV